jgi:hypothetical protein
VTRQGAQVDLRFDRRDGIINVCEMTHSSEPFGVAKSHAVELRQRLRLFESVPPLVRGTKTTAPQEPHSTVPLRRGPTSELQRQRRVPPPTLVCPPVQPSSNGTRESSFTP